MAPIKIYLLGGGLGAVVRTAEVAAGGGGTASTHWRIVPLGNSPEGSLSSDNAELFIGEIEMAASISGPNLCTGGSVLTYGGGWGFASNAFDGTVTAVANYTGGNFSSDFNCAIGYQFPTSVVIGAVRVKASPTTSQAERMMRAFTLQYSTDGGTTWLSKEPIGPVADFTAAESRTYEVSALVTKTRTDAKIWRVRTSAYVGGSGDTYVGEIYWRTSAGGTNLAQTSTGVAFGTGTASGIPAHRRLYDNNGNSWINVGTSTMHAFFFETAPNPSNLGYFTWFGGTQYIYNIDYSSDGVSWTTVVSVSATTSNGGSINF